MWDPQTCTIAIYVTGGVVLALVGALITRGARSAGTTTVKLPLFGEVRSDYPAIVVIFVGAFVMALPLLKESKAAPTIHRPQIQFSGTEVQRLPGGPKISGLVRADGAKVAGGTITVFLAPVSDEADSAQGKFVLKVPEGVSEGKLVAWLRDRDGVDAVHSMQSAGLLDTPVTPQASALDQTAVRPWGEPPVQ